ncbi:hypothetical protein HMPREF2854_06240 [Actinomyces sp. HMSC075B09]|nr:hypothetical protein HMPREF2854_06240 [Actinomyces sp. HMSC075B09]
MNTHRFSSKYDLGRCGQAPHRPKIEIIIPISIYDINPDRALSRQSRHDRTKCASRPPISTNDATQIIRINANLQKLSASHRPRAHLDIIRIINNPTDKMF